MAATGALDLEGGQGVALCIHLLWLAPLPLLEIIRMPHGQSETHEDQGGLSGTQVKSVRELTPT